MMPVLIPAGHPAADRRQKLLPFFVRLSVSSRRIRIANQGSTVPGSLAEWLASNQTVEIGGSRATPRPKPVSYT